MIRRYSTFVLTVALMLGASSVSARTVTVDLEAADVDTLRPKDARLGPFYTMHLPIPAREPGETLMEAWLELIVDATTDADARAMAGIATPEVFPLSGTPSAELTQTMLRPMPMARTVRLGTGRRVRVDITEHVRYLLDPPKEDHGLALGSLTAQRPGRFVLRPRQAIPGEPAARSPASRDTSRRRTRRPAS